VRKGDNSSAAMVRCLMPGTQVAQQEPRDCRARLRNALVRCPGSGC
jgi:hypothetical protein